jgi:hypothetical protein
MVSFGQNRQGHRFSREETAEILLDRSKKDRTEGVIALGGGIALSAIGIHLMQKDPYTTTLTASSLTVRRSDNYIWGASLLALGVTSALSSPFFFLRAGRLKHKARLMMSDESTSFLNTKIFVPSFALKISF